MNVVYSQEYLSPRCLKFSNSVILIERIPIHDWKFDLVQLIQRLETKCVYMNVFHYRPLFYFLICRIRLDHLSVATVDL